MQTAINKNRANMNPLEAIEKLHEIISGLTARHMGQSRELDRLRSVNAELLAACQAVQEIWDRGHCFTGEPAEAREAMRTAIAHAKGVAL